jgi:hypothetical protein
MPGNKNPRIFIRGKARGLCERKLGKHEWRVNAFLPSGESRRAKRTRDGHT